MSIPLCVTASATEYHECVSCKLIENTDKIAVLTRVCERVRVRKKEDQQEKNKTKQNKQTNK